jgi:hypothetical protein
MSMQGFLVDRDDELAKARSLWVRDSAARAWMQSGATIEQRLLRFDGWVRLELAARIDWTWAGEQQPRRIEQCRIELENLVLALFRRGWHLDGTRLAQHINDALDDVAAAQKAGRVRDFWPFFKSVVDRYVGINAEEIRTEAMSAGAHVGQVFERLQRAAPKAPAMPELLAQRAQETLATRLQRQRALEARQKADKQANAGQAQLF